MDLSNSKKQINDNKASVSPDENHRHVIIGSSNVRIAYFMLKILENLDDKRPIYIIFRSPNQYPIYKTDTDIKPKYKYKRSVAIFDDMLGTGNSSQIDEFFTRGRHEI